MDTLEDKRRNLNIRIDLVALYELTPAELKLYGHYIRRAGMGKGECTESIKNTARWVGMSVNTVRNARQGLIEKKFISMIEREVEDMNLTNLITINDVTMRNMDWYSENVSERSEIDSVLPKNGVPPTKNSRGVLPKIGSLSNKREEEKEKEHISDELQVIPSFEDSPSQKDKSTKGRAPHQRHWGIAMAVLGTDNPTQVKTRLPLAQSVEKILGSETSGDEITAMYAWLLESGKASTEKYLPKKAESIAAALADYRERDREMDDFIEGLLQMTPEEIGGQWGLS